MAMKLPGDLSGKAVDHGQLMQNEAIATMRANELKNRQVIAPKAVIAEQERDKVTVESQTHESELNAAFDEKFIPSPECENPSEELFARCVNDRMHAKVEFFELHKFE
jgi:hypothetical protein